jgi:L-amino acid N-acyltransferase YncA
MDYSIEPLTEDHWEAVRAIYLEGIATGNATFETAAPTWSRWDQGHMQGCRLVARSQGEVVGWAALSPVSGRCVYAGVAEASLYVAERARRKGIGRALLEDLIVLSEESGLWTLQAGIFPENTASLAVFKRCGFREVGIRERLGKHHGNWRDVVLLERRSSVIGMD